jgi:serine/threonine protein kinase
MAWFKDDNKQNVQLPRQLKSEEDFDKFATFVHFYVDIDETYQRPDDSDNGNHVGKANASVLLSNRITTYRSVSISKISEYTYDELRKRLFSQQSMWHALDNFKEFTTIHYIIPGMIDAISIAEWCPFNLDILRYSPMMRLRLPVKRLIQQMTQAIVTLHSLGYIHSHLKSSKFLIQETYVKDFYGLGELNVKLSDFILMKHRSDFSSCDAFVDAQRDEMNSLMQIIRDFLSMLPSDYLNAGQLNQVNHFLNIFTRTASDQRTHQQYRNHIKFFKWHPAIQQPCLQDSLLCEFGEWCRIDNGYLGYRSAPWPKDPASGETSMEPNLAYDIDFYTSQPGSATLLNPAGISQYHEWYNLIPNSSFRDLKYNQKGDLADHFNHVSWMIRQYRNKKVHFWDGPEGIRALMGAPILVYLKFWTEHFGIVFCRIWEFLISAEAHQSKFPCMFPPQSDEERAMAAAFASARGGNGESPVTEPSKPSSMPSSPNETQAQSQDSPGKAGKTSELPKYSQRVTLSNTCLSILPESKNVIKNV